MSQIINLDPAAYTPLSNVENLLKWQNACESFIGNVEADECTSEQDSQFVILFADNDRFLFAISMGNPTVATPRYPASC